MKRYYEKLMWKEKYFEELTTKELYQVLRARAEIFVVEQNCIYQDMDGIDERSLHIFCEDEDGKVLAYLRLFEKEGTVLQMGRVMTLEHGRGLGKELLRRGIKAAKDKMKGTGIFIEAQRYATGFYESEGFQICSDEFMEDGIPHVQMMLQFKGLQAERIFYEYASDYDRADGKINLKIIHTQEVAKVMDYITEHLQLPPRVRELAHVCAMFHDIGRFQQVVRYGTFLDHLSVDHALLGCEILRENHLCSFLTSEEEEQVLTAIANHNKLKIEDGLPEDTLLLCKLIRDADKCDIFRVFACEDLVDTMDATLEEVEEEVVTQEVYDCFMRHECIDKRIRKTGLDKWVGFLSFFFDIYFRESIDYLMENKYYRVQFDRAEFKQAHTREQVRVIMEELENFISNAE